MTRTLAAALALSLSAPALAQVPQRAPEGPPQAAPAAQAGAAAAPASPGNAPATAPAPKGPRELEQAKKLGLQGLVKIAPKLGGSRAEKLARDRGGVVVDKALDLAADKAGVAPKK
jgi:hypothetical protein